MNGTRLERFKLTITRDPANDYERYVTALGYAPDENGQFRAVKKIQATLTKLRWASVLPPAALAITGALDVGGNATIDARSNHCSGGSPSGGSMSTGTTARTGNSAIYGPGNDVANELADMPQGSLNSVPTMTWDELQTLRALAKATGTYYQGPTTFDGNNPLPSQGGIVFIDTTTGNDLTVGPPATPTSEMGTVTITGSQTFSGWIIALGDVTVSGTVSLTGSIYARNDFVFDGNGTITGAVTTANKLLTVQSSVDSTQSGNSTLNYHCTAAQTGGGTVSATGWVLKPLTYREVEGS